MARSLPLARRASVLCAAAVLAMPLAALSQTPAWPSAPLKLVVPSTPGGALDAYARVSAEHLSKQLGQPVVVENRASAGGTVATEAVARAPADGLTLLVGTAATMTINPSAYARLGYSQDDFTPLCKGVGAPLVLVTHPSVEARTAAELSAWFKARPAQASYASYQPGTPSHFLGHQLGDKLGVPFTHVPYKGSAPQVVDLVGGIVPLGFTQLQTALPHLRGGRLRAVAVTASARVPSLPDVPTVAELGWPDLTTSVWFGLLAPRAVPREITDRLIEAHRRTLADPAVRERFAAQGLEAAGTCGADFAAQIRQETARWAAVVKATGFTAQD